LVGLYVKIGWQGRGLYDLLGRKIMSKIADRIGVDPNVIGGKATIRGLRINVQQILKALAAGTPRQELLEEYPELEPEDIQAALAYAAALISQEKVLPIKVG